MGEFCETYRAAYADGYRDGARDSMRAAVVAEDRARETEAINRRMGKEVQRLRHELIAMGNKAGASRDDMRWVLYGQSKLKEQDLGVSPVAIGEAG